MTPSPNDETIPAPGFPRLLRSAWRASDPATRCMRRCDALDKETVHQKLTTHAGDYWLCGTTGLLTRDNPNMQISDVYDRWWARPIPEVELKDSLRKHKEALAKFAPHRKTGRLFEVGSGHGLLLKAATELGWQVEGNELSEPAAEAAQQWVGATVHPGPIESVQLPSGVFDVVIVDNVFEHLWKPLEVIRRLSQSLRPGGVLYLHTLNAQSLSLWRHPAGWHYFRATHFHAPTLVSLNHYFAAAGLKPIFMRTHGFRLLTKKKGEKSPRWAALIEKLVSQFAGIAGSGHRVEYMVQKQP